MKKLLTLLALTALAGCQERVTAPTSAMTPSAPNALFVQPTVDIPPPPPLDTGMAVNYDGASVLLRTRYFLNKTGTNGWLTVASDASAGVSVTDGARVAYHRGTFSGKGTLSVATSDGVLMVDLSSVSPASAFGDCVKLCFSLGFSSATFTDARGTRKLDAVSFQPVAPVRGDDVVIGR